MSDFKMKDRVANLMRKASDPASSEAEAQAALNAANKLMAKYGFTEADIDSATKSDYRAWEIMVPAGRKNFDPVVRLCGGTVAKFTGCFGFHTPNRGEKAQHITFYGLDSDVQYAQWLIESFQQQMNKSWDSYARWNMPSGLTRKQIVAERIGFVRGFCARVCERLNEVAKGAEPEQKTGNALVLKKQDLAKRRAEEQHGTNFDGKYNASGRGNASSNAQGAGYVAGGAASTAASVTQAARTITHQ